MFQVIRNQQNENPSRNVKLGETKPISMESTDRIKVDSTENDLVITISREIIDFEEVQKLINYLRYRALVSKSEATDEDIDQIVNEINEGLALRNRSKLEE